MKFLQVLFKVIITLSCMFLVYKMIDVNKLVASFKGLPLWFIPLILSISIARGWLNALRWKIVNVDTANPMTNWQYFRYTMISKAFNLIMPGALGGDFVRAAIVYKKVEKAKGKNIISVFSDRFIGLLSILILGFLASIFTSYMPNKKTIILLFSVILTLIFVGILLTYYSASFVSDIDVSNIGKIRKKVLGLVGFINEVILYYVRNPFVLTKGILISFPAHFLCFLLYYATASFLNIELTFLEVSSITSIVWLVSAIPISISGIGVRELSFVYLFSLHAITTEEATLFSVYVFMITIIGSLSGIIFLLFKDPKKKYGHGSEQGNTSLNPAN